MYHLKPQPKLFISMIYPLLALIILSLMYVGYSDYKYIKKSTYQQAENNLDIANEYLEQHLNAINNQLFLLSETYRYNYNLTDFLLSAQHIVDNENKYLEIGLLNEKHEYYATNYVYNTYPKDNRSRTWYNEEMDSETPFISPLYKSEQTQKWTVAIVRLFHLSNGQTARLVLELDILGLYDKLSLLKTLMNGYVYAVDSKTGQIVMHPNPARIATQSISLPYNELKKIAKNKALATNKTSPYTAKNIIHYTYEGNEKFSIYQANNQLGWVLLSNSNNADMKYKVLNIGAVSIALLAVLALLSMIYIISSRVHTKGQVLSSSTNLEDIYQTLFQLATELTRFDNLFFFIHNPYNQKFEEPIHNLSLPEFDVFQELAGKKVEVLKITNPLISGISSRQPCIRIPLYNKSDLIGVIYLTDSNTQALHF